MEASPRERERETEREMKNTDLPRLCSELASPIEDFNLLEMQKNEEQNFVGISFFNDKVSGREKRSEERGRKFLEKKNEVERELGCLSQSVEQVPHKSYKI